MKRDDKQHKIEKNPQKPTGHRRLWLFRLIAITAVPVVILLLLEMGLRLFGYGYSPDVMIKNNVNGIKGHSENIQFGWRFFPRNIAREFAPFFITDKKSDNTYRIFILGGSAARGDFLEAYSFGRILRVMLNENYPEVQFEVINLAMAAINSHVVLEIIKDCTKHDPDLFIVYLGNNEVVGPYGAGTVFNPFSSNLAFIRLSIALKKYRIGQWFTSLIESVSNNKDLSVSWRGLEFFLEHKIRADNFRLKSVYQHFDRNLEDIVRVAQKNGSKIIVSTVVSNLKNNPPFASLHRADLTEPSKNEWERFYQQGVIYEEAQKYDDAVEHYLAAINIDDTYADLHYRLGQCYWAMCEYEAAKDRYARALQLDALRFRADTAINNIVRRVADNRISDGVYMVDGVKTFGNNSPHGIPGEEFFYDHVHLNFSGNYLLAKILFDQVERILPTRIRSQKASDYLLLTEDDCTQRLAYTEWDRYVFYDFLYSSSSKPPFTNQLYHTERIQKIEQTRDQIQENLTSEVFETAVNQYRQAISKDTSDWWLHWNFAKLSSKGLNNDQMAYQAYSWVMNLLPHYYNVYSAMGYVLGNQGKFEAAINCFKEALRIKPTSSQDHFFWGLAYQNQNERDKATKHYLKTIQLQPTYAPAWVNLAVIQYEQGEIEKAIKTCRDGIQFNSNVFDLHYFLANLLTQQGNMDEAVVELRTALEINPDFEEAQEALKSIL